MRFPGAWMKFLCHGDGLTGMPKRRPHKARKILLGIIFAGMLALRPAPAAAGCCVWVCPPTCDPGTILCAVTDDAFAFAALIAFVEAQYLLIAPPVVDALAGFSSGISAMISAQMKQIQEIYLAAVKQRTLIKYDITSKELIISEAVNTQREQCRLETSKMLADATAGHQRDMAKAMDRASSSLALNQLYDTQRMRSSALQRYCKNGMLRRPPGPAGTTAFDQMGCFEDPVFTDAYLQSGRVLDHLALVPPPGAIRGTYPDGKPITDMSILDNPDDPLNPVSAQVVWNRLTDKQKNYVAALRYCQHLEQSRLQVTKFTRDEASTPENMRRITKNLSSTGLLQSLASVCYSEVARRTAPNIYDASDPAMGATAMLLKRDDDEKVARQLDRAGIDPTVYRAHIGYDLATGRPVNPVPNQVFISPALYQYAKYHAYCADRTTSDLFDMESGTAANAYQNKLKCEHIMQRYKTLEARYAELFTQADEGMKAIGAGFMVPVPTPMRSENDSDGVRRVNLRAGKAPSFVPMGQLIKQEKQAAERRAPAPATTSASGALP
ncbi:MAG: hypothetical protein WBK91_10345 [Alphaproteobacteria bacterium]